MDSRCAVPLDMHAELIAMIKDCYFIDVASSGVLNMLHNMHYMTLLTSVVR